MKPSLLSRAWSYLSPRNLTREAEDLDRRMGVAIAHIITDREAEITDLTDRFTAMHRRAQKAEGEVARWPRQQAAHAQALARAYAANRDKRTILVRRIREYADLLRSLGVPHVREVDGMEVTEGRVDVLIRGLAAQRDAERTDAAHQAMKVVFREQERDEARRSLARRETAIVEERRTCAAALVERDEALAKLASVHAKLSGIAPLGSTVESAVDSLAAEFASAIGRRAVAVEKETAAMLKLDLIEAEVIRWTSGDALSLDDAARRIIAITRVSKP